MTASKGIFFKTSRHLSRAGQLFVFCARLDALVEWSQILAQRFFPLFVFQLHISDIYERLTSVCRS